MPPKINDKLKQKIIEDKTFGLKNKKKSKVVQQFVKQVEKTIDARNAPKRGVVDPNAVRKAEKEEKEKFQKELATFIKPVQQTKVPTGADPKSVICEFFKQGLCAKGNKCKFSHDLSQERKSAKIDLYTDQRETTKEETGMEGWDQATLEAAVTKQMNKVQTDIICKYFLEAVETRKYGWFWVCPNGNDKCIYRHALPPGYVLKSDQKKLEAQAAEDVRILEEEIEEERMRIRGSTPLTLQSFLEWRRKREEKKAVAAAEVQKKALEAAKHKKPTQMSGRALFDFNPDLFVDDDDAAVEYERHEGEEDVVEISASGTSITYKKKGGDDNEDDGEEEDGENEEEEGEEEGAAAACDMAIQEALFLEGDVPDDIPDE